MSQLSSPHLAGRVLPDLAGPERTKLAGPCLGAGTGEPGSFLRGPESETRKGWLGRPSEELTSDPSQDPVATTTMAPVPRRSAYPEEATQLPICPH